MCLHVQFRSGRDRHGSALNVILTRTPSLQRRAVRKMGLHMEMWKKALFSYACVPSGRPCLAILHLASCAACVVQWHPVQFESCLVVLRCAFHSNVNAICIWKSESGWEAEQEVVCYQREMETFRKEATDTGNENKLILVCTLLMCLEFKLSVCSRNWNRSQDRNIPAGLLWLWKDSK